MLSFVKMGKGEYSVCHWEKRVNLFHVFTQFFFNDNLNRKKQLGEVWENSIKMYLIETDFEDVNCI